MCDEPYDGKKVTGYSGGTGTASSLDALFPGYDTGIHCKRIGTDSGAGIAHGKKDFAEASSKFVKTV